MGERKNELNCFMKNIELNPNIFNCKPVWIFLNPILEHSEVTKMISKMERPTYIQSHQRLSNLYPELEELEYKDEDDCLIKKQIPYLDTNIEFFRQFA